MRKADKRDPSPVTKLDSRRTAREWGAPSDAKVRALLEHWVRAPTTPQRVVRRSRIVLLSIDGVPAREISSRLAVSRATVVLWTRRFVESGPHALLHDALGRGRPRIVTAETMCDRLRQANLLGPDNLPLTVRRAAAFLGISATSVWRALNRSSRSKRNRQAKRADSVS